MPSLNKDDNYYRQLIVQHYSQPTNKGLLRTKTSYTFHHNQNACIDDFYIELTLNQDKIIAARFDGMGCAISTASIDIFTTLIENKTIVQVQNINQCYQDMLAGKAISNKELGDLVAFKNVLHQPSRLRCALIISESIDKILVQK